VKPTETLAKTGPDKNV